MITIKKLEEMQGWQSRWSRDLPGSHERERTWENEHLGVRVGVERVVAHPAHHHRGGQGREGCRRAGLAASQGMK